MFRVLIVCTGNTCRSPMAEAILKDLAAHAGKPFEVRSAGITAINGAPMALPAQQTLQKRRLPSSLVASLLTAEQVLWANVILTMTLAHKQMILARFPESIYKTFTLKEYALLDDPRMDDLIEAEKLYSELQMKQLLGERLDHKKQERLAKLRKCLPDFDIADPFGSELDVYEQTADEIEDVLMTVVEKWAQEPKHS